MFLVSQDRAKALDMADIKSYFIYKAEGDFPSDEDKEKECLIWANTQWKNPCANDCDNWCIGIFENFDAAQKVMNELISINHTAEGKAVIRDNEVEVLYYLK